MASDPVRDVTVNATVNAYASTQSNSAETEFTRLKQLVRSVLQRGLCLDDPWRHAYLRQRWTGQGAD
jgi:hypothetical protein